MSMAATRHWPLPDTHNVRDLGGYARKSGGETRWGRILRGEALHALTAESVEALVAEGLSLVIDLRGPHETGVTQHPFLAYPGVAYTNVVLFDALAPIAMAKPPFDMAHRYCDALDQCGQQIANVMRAIVEALPGVVLFHCTAGKDRTGVVAALLLSLATVSKDDIAADYALTASAEGLIANLRARALSAGGDADHIERMLASDAGTMLTMLDHLDRRHGGIQAYLAAIGLGESEIARLNDRLCA
jgi:protein-tyrosine phosphatase